MRTEGITGAGGPRHYGDPIDLPREPREDRETVRARYEAKRAASWRDRSPFARRTEREAAEALYAPHVDTTYAEFAFTTPPSPDDVDDAHVTQPEPVPAALVADQTPQGAGAPSELTGDQPAEAESAQPSPPADGAPRPAGPLPALAATTASELAPESASAAPTAGSPAGDDEDPCEARHEDAHEGATVLCTRPRGHDGEHVAHDGADVVVATWPADESVPAPKPAAKTPARQASARRRNASVDELLGALSEYVERLPRGVTRTRVLGDVVDRLHAGTRRLHAQTALTTPGGAAWPPAEPR